MLKHQLILKHLLNQLLLVSGAAVGPVSLLAEAADYSDPSYARAAVDPVSPGALSSGLNNYSWCLEQLLILYLLVAEAADYPASPGARAAADHASPCAWS
jgi:hypothetical protein